MFGHGRLVGSLRLLEETVLLVGDCHARFAVVGVFLPQPRPQIFFAHLIVQVGQRVEQVVL